MIDVEMGVDVVGERVQRRLDPGLESGSGCLDAKSVQKALP